MIQPDPFAGDLMLYPTMDGGDVILRGGQPDMDDGLSTAAYISLFGGDYWGNSNAPDNSHKLTGATQKIVDGKYKGAQTLLDLQSSAATDLQWMLDDGSEEIGTDFQMSPFTPVFTRNLHPMGAIPDTGALLRRMKEVYSEYYLATRKGREASRQILSRYTWAQAARRFIGICEKYA